MKTEFVSLADRLRESGMEKKNWIATEKMLRKGYKVSEICDILDVTTVFVEKVKKQMNSSGNN